MAAGIHRSRILGALDLFSLAALALLCLSFGLMLATPVLAQNAKNISEAENGPVMSAYLGYLRNEQEVVDDRSSRHEIDAAYYRLNSSRIRALRQMAIAPVKSPD